MRPSARTESHRQPLRALSQWTAYCPRPLQTPLKSGETLLSKAFPPPHLLLCELVDELIGPVITRSAPACLWECIYQEIMAQMGGVWQDPRNTLASRTKGLYAKGTPSKLPTSYYFLSCLQISLNIHCVFPQQTENGAHTPAGRKRMKTAEQSPVGTMGVL